MARVVGTEALPGEFLLHPVHAPLVWAVVATPATQQNRVNIHSSPSFKTWISYRFFLPGVVGVGAADQELVVVRLGEDPDVVVAVVLALPLHQAELRLPLTGVPGDPPLKVLLQSINQS